MDRNELHKRLPTVVEALVASVVNEPRMKHLDRVYLPSWDEVVACIGLLRELLFPGYFGKQGLTSVNVTDRLGEVVEQLAEKLFEQVRHCVRYRQNLPGDNGGGDGGGNGGNAAADALDADCDQQAGTIVSAFLDRIPAVRAMLSTDVQAAFDSDPAAQSTDETVFSYPGLYAISVQRLAHEFYLLDVPLLPRIMTEHAHSLTGIDIHPGAKLGSRFFIDHGTGVVIGETTEIGDNVKIYQGVTLGALSPDFGQALRGRKRHPKIEDDVTIYAGATILGGETVIGRGSVIGGNVFITRSVPPQNRVSAEPPKLKYRDRSKRKDPADEFLDFQI
jgi:serine O-acetyltransferase